MMDGMKEFEGKRVYVLLKSNRNYTGTVLSVNDSFLILNDKFGNRVSISISDIEVLEEQR